MKEMSVLAKNKCYILPYCQGTDPCGAVKHFTKYCLTAIPLTLPPCSDRLYTFQGTFIQNVVELNATIFPYTIV